MNIEKKSKKQQLFNGLVFYSALKEMEQELNDIDYVIIKGEPLSMLAYGYFGCRTSHDIDILKDKKNVSILDQILNKHGFYQLNRNLSRLERILANQAHQTFSYIKKVSNNIVVIDVNVDVFWGEYEGKRIDISDFISDRKEMNIFGFKTKILNPMKTLVALILHHYKELNSLHQLSRAEHPYKEKLFNDVYSLINRNTIISPQGLLDICSVYEIIPYTYFVLYYTNRFIGNNVLGEYVNLFETEEGKELLDCYGLTKQEKKKWSITFEERLQTANLYPIIMNDLSQKDIHKIQLQKKIFNNSKDKIEVISNE